MKVINISKKLIPAVFAISTITASNAFSTNQIKNQEIYETDKVEISTPPQKENNVISLWDILTCLGLGTLGGAAGALAVRKILNKKELPNDAAYFDQEFQRDAEKMYSTMIDMLTETIAYNFNHINKKYLSDDVVEFTKKYPSRAVSYAMFVSALQDSKLDDMEREIICQYLALKTTFSNDEEKEIIEVAYPYFENTKNYDELVKAIKERTVSSSENTTSSENNTVNKKANNKEDEEEDQAITFDTVHHNLRFKDVGGQEEAIKLLKKSILFPIKYPKAFECNSIKHGFLLYGPSGTGKTLLSEVLANEAKAHFIKLNGNELTSKWVGETEENWRKLFKEAKENQPSIIFIDEFDGIAAKRGGGDKYNDKFVNQLLGLISDIEKNNDQVYIIATTNRPDMIDNAILRPGRIGKQIELKAPQTTKDVYDILQIHIKKFPHDEKLNLNKFSEILLKENVTGADIAFIVNEAYEASLERNAIYEKMDNNTFNLSNMQKVKIMPADMENALNTYKEKNRKSVVGFKK